MITGARQMMCGNCGGLNFKMYNVFTQDLRLIAECCECESTSIIKPSLVRIDIDWGENSDGILCPK